MADITLKCAQCGTLFTADRHQRSKFRRSGGAVKSCCSYECICAFRATKATKPSGHYDQICSECGNTFRSSASQLHRWNINPDKKLVCSEVCNARRKSIAAQVMHKEGKLKWGSPAQIAVFAVTWKRSGPTHHTWKTGYYSKDMKETRSLIYNIKKFIKEGAKA